MQGLLGNSLLGKASLWGGGGSSIKSIQSGNVYFSTNTATPYPITISNIDPSNSAVTITSSSPSNNPRFNRALATIVDATTISFDTGQNIAIGDYCWTVIEFNNVKSKQVGTGTITNNGTFTPSISSVNLSKSILFFSYKNPSNYNYGVTVSGKISGATQLIFTTLEPSSGLYTIGWQVIEFN